MFIGWQNRRFFGTLPNYLGWVRGEDIPPPDPGLFIYNLLTLNPIAVLPYRDGALLGKIEGELRMYYGWNGNYPPGYTPSCVKQVSTPDGVTWTDIVDMPGPARHFPMFCGEWLGYSEWVFGGDVYIPCTNIVAYNPNTHSWEIVTTDWGLGNLTLGTGILHNNKFYAINHLTQKVYVCTNGTTFTEIGTFPVNASTAKGYSFGGHLWVVGGSNDPGSNQGWATSLYKGTVSGSTVTWEALPLPSHLRGTWPGGYVFDNKMWYNAGYAPPGGNTAALYYTTDFVTVTRLTNEYGVNSNISSTHAAAFKTADIGQGERLYTCSGNNDPAVSYAVEKLPFYDAIPTGSTLVIMLRNGVFSDGSPLAGNYCGQVSDLAGTDTFEVGFIGGTGTDKYDINVAAVEAWAAGRNFYWSKYYDRSGNGHHHTNTPGNTPLAGTAGVMTLLNGKPAAYSATGTKYLAPVSGIPLGTDYIISSVLQFDVLGKELIDGTLGYGFYNDTGTATVYHNNGVTAVAVTPRCQINTEYLEEIYRAGSTIRGFQNGVDSGQLGVMSGSFTYENLRGENSTYGFIGFLKQLIIKAGALTVSERKSNRLSIQTNTNNYYNLYPNNIVPAE